MNIIHEKPEIIVDLAIVERKMNNCSKANEVTNGGKRSYETNNLVVNCCRSKENSTATWKARVPFKFALVQPPNMCRKAQVRYLHGFSFSSRLKNRTSIWLIPRKLVCALLWKGVFMFIIGVITMVMCRHEFETATTHFQALRSIAIALLAGSFALIGLSIFIFVHAHYVNYVVDHFEPMDSEDQNETVDILRPPISPFIIMDGNSKKTSCVSSRYRISESSEKSVQELQPVDSYAMTFSPPVRSQSITSSEDSNNDIFIVHSNFPRTSVVNPIESASKMKFPTQPDGATIADEECYSDGDYDNVSK